jgi:hypothetical protein
MIWMHNGHTGNSITHVYDTVSILILNSKNLYISYPLTYIDSSGNEQNGVVFYTLSH